MNSSLKEKGLSRQREPSTDVPKTPFRISSKGTPIPKINTFGIGGGTYSKPESRSGSVLKRSSQGGASVEKYQLGSRMTTSVLKPRSTSKEKKRDLNAFEDSRVHRRQVSFQLTDSMIAKIQSRPPTGDTADTQTDNKLVPDKDKLFAQTTINFSGFSKLKNQPSSNQGCDLLAEAKKNNFFTKISVTKKAAAPKKVPYYIHEMCQAFSTVKPSQKDQLFRDQLSEHFQIRDYFEHVKPVTVDQIIEKKKFFPRKEKDKAKAFTLVLDMDETLIHTIEQDRSFDAVVDSYDDEHLIQTKFNFRPHLKQFLQTVNQKFEVIVFTASESGYADPILDRIDPKGELISHRFYRQNCIEMEKNLFVKDLRVFGQRPLDKTCIVDNALHSYIINLRNGIPIIPFMHERSDDQLLKLADFLMSLDTEVDIRKSIAAHFSYKEFLGCTDKAQFVEMLKSKVKS